MGQAFVLFHLIVCNQQVLGFLVIPVHEVDKIFLFKSPYADALMIFIQTSDIVCVLNHQHPLRPAMMQHQISQPRLALPREFILRIRGKLRVVARVTKDEIFLFRLRLFYKILKVQIIYSCLTEMLLQPGRLIIAELAVHRLAIIGNSAIRHIELPIVIIPEHSAVGIVSYEQEQSGA